MATIKFHRIPSPVHHIYDDYIIEVFNEDSSFKFDYKSIYDQNEINSINQSLINIGLIYYKLDTNLYGFLIKVDGYYNSFGFWQRSLVFVNTNHPTKQRDLMRPWSFN